MDHHTPGTSSRPNRLSPIVLATCLLLAVIVIPCTAGAQTLTLGVIEGTVTDETGAALPGVTVTLTSPALQVRQLTTVTDSAGRYRFGEVRVGAYRLQFELQGFQTFVRENLELEVGFAARVDATLNVGSLTETVVVSGASPVVDLTTTRGGQALNTALITKAIPMVGHQVDLVRLTPGLSGGVGTRSGNPTQMGLQANMSVSAYGQTGVTAMIEDFQMHSNNQPPMLGGTDQMDVRSFGNSAEVQNPGAVVNYVFSSGGNQFHGRGTGLFMHESLQSSNIDTLVLRAQRFTTPEELKNYFDVQGNLGGRLVRDKLWFFATGRKRKSERTIGGFAANAGPDGQYLTGDEPPAVPVAEQWGQVLKLSYQATPKYQMTALWWRDGTADNGSCTTGYFGGANCRTIPFEASTIYNLRDLVWNGEVRGTPRNNVTFHLKAGRAAYQTRYYIQPGSDLLPTRWNRNTQLYTGSPISNGNTTSAQRRGDTRFHQYTGAITYIPSSFLRGEHQFKVGFRTNLALVGGGASNHPAGNYGLVFDTVGGVPNQAVEITTFSLPVEPKNGLNLHSLYATDQWRLGRRLTFNLGLRFDRQTTFIPAQVQEPSTFVNAAEYAAIDVGAWNMWAPRAAVAWDPTGSGKNVVKAAYGWYNDELPYFVATFTDIYNPVFATATTYRWRDLNGNRDYDPGEVNLNVNGPDFIDIMSAANTRPLGPNFKLPHSHEVAVSVERELLPNMGSRVLYVYKRRVDDYGTVNAARPYSAYNIPLQRRDPGPDGVVNTPDDGSMVTIYDYDPAYRGAQFVSNERVNEINDDSAHTVELSVNKRMSSRWSLMTSYGATKQHRWLDSFIDTPNLEYFPLDETWSWIFRGSGSYVLPYDVLLGGTLNVRTGVQGQRTYIFRAADPLGGPQLTQLTTVMLRLEPYGAQTGPAQKYLDFRLGKTFDLGGARELLFSMDVLNALNDSAAQAITHAAGPTFGQITLIPMPRALRFGIQYAF
jgi:hypothetical protein